MIRPTTVLALVVGILYVPFLGNPLTWDDRTYMVDSPLTKSWRNLPAAFTTDREALGWNERPAYRPLATITYFPDYAAWGLRPVGRRLPNLAIHIATVLILFRILEYLTGATGPAFWAALLFGVHPANSEVVFCVMFRHAGLSGLALGLVTWLHLTHHSPRRAGGGQARRTVAARAVLALGLLAKETLVTTPVLIWLLERFIPRPLPSPRRSPFRAALPYAVIVAVYAGLRGWFLPAPTLDPIPPGMTPRGLFVSQILTALSAIPPIALQMVWPARLAVDYVVPRVDGWSDPRLPAAAGLIAAGLLAAWRLARKAPLAACGLLWCAVAALPTMRWLSFNGTYEMADRYLYLPLMGAAMCLAALLAAAQKHRPLYRAALGVVIAGVAAGSVRTYARGFDWQHPRRLYSDNAVRFPASYKAWGNLALTYLAEGDFRTARYHLLTAARLGPGDVRVWLNLGRALEGLRDGPGAIRAFEEALRRDPNNATAYRLLAATYDRLGRPREAERARTNARRLGDPGPPRTGAPIL